ncbi:glycosyltransferase [Pedobacter cryophilus]|uniref:Glycosyltransferase n=1 Tax=Pedobacter cryophilus TaxID=2571271 RepID=A0A4U1C1B3_9SPHI|nr:glycosyltransferase [Pedobacter cryophilus]TKB98754.1 glycosyltransferase [Pedobacter cryophilus]
MIEYFFWVFIFLIVYTYLVYPAILNIIAKKIKVSPLETDLEPFVSIIIPVYNEELCIKSKIESIFKNNYPLDKIEVIVYSDGSDDQTENIVIHLMDLHPQLKFLSHQERKGKSFVVNKLVEASKFDLILLTDANIIFEKDAIKQNLKNYSDKNIGLVASLVINQIPKDDHITYQEKKYVSWENNIKYNEGLIWGSTIAPFGACFSFRKEFFVTIPENFLVDDFFIATQVLKKNQRCILEKESLCYEELIGSVAVEFKRRKRISAGNFQNLAYFFKTFTQIFKPIGFCFWSHKGLRWFTPFFLLSILIFNFLLLDKGWIYQVVMIFQVLFYCTPLTVYVASKLKSINKLVKFAHYFLMMNIALMIGFFNYLRGIEVGYWDITQRRR